MSAFAEPQDGSSLLTKGFTLAAWVAILGVCSAWFYLKQNTATVAVALPELPPMMTVTDTVDVLEDSPLARARDAYAAGRIVRPRGDSALDYFQQAVAADPASVEAQQGLERVVTYLINGAEDALARDDLPGARELAEHALAVSVDNRAARSVVDRVSREEALRDLLARAATQLAANRLTRPADDNALATYRQVLSMDPGNAVARQGLETVAQRLATIAQTEAFAENHERARALVAQAKKIAPDAPGIAETEQLTSQWSRIVKDQVFKEDLLAAARAMREGRYVADAGGLGALEYYRSALQADPGSTAASSGVELAMKAVLERLWEKLADDDIEAATLALVQAEDAGLDAQLLAAAGEELDFLRQRQRAFAGEFDVERAIGDLEFRYQQVPVVPQGVKGGWAELMFTVGVDGVVKDIEVSGLSHEKLRKPVLSAVKRWRFEPFEERGRVLPVRTGVRFSFQE